MVPKYKKSTKTVERPCEVISRDKTPKTLRTFDE